VALIYSYGVLSVTKHITIVPIKSFFTLKLLFIGASWLSASNKTMDLAGFIDTSQPFF